MTTSSAASPRLSLETILDAATSMIRSEGFDALSMRKLAQRCGVGAMTLYGYVRTKEELLTLIGERFFLEVAEPDAGLNWQDQLRHVFRMTHRIFLQHPELADIAARQHFNATAAYRGAETVFAAMERAGLSPELAMSAFVALTSFTAGIAQRQANADARAANERRLQQLRELPSEEFKHVRRLAQAMVSGVSDQHFEDGLALFISGIEQQGAAAAAAAKKARR